MTKKTNIAKKFPQKPILKNLTIKNFRCFENFELKNLKRINIFVGDNNSGKSSVLEAVGFLSPSLKDHFRILKSRDDGFADFNSLKKCIKTIPFAITIWKFEWLFFKKNPLNNPEFNAEFASNKTSLKNLKLKIFKTKKIEKFIENNERLEDDYDRVEAESILFEYQFNNKKNSQKIGFSSLGTYDSIIKNFNDYQVIYLSDEVPSISEIIEKWSKLKESANLKESNEIDEKYLNIAKYFEKDLKKIELIGNFELAFRKNDFTVYLEDLGNGFKKFFDILLTIDLASKNNIPTLLCIDEIDNGLYYDKQDLFWEQIIKLCKEKNIQLFATTHSYEALQSILECGTKLYPKKGEFDEVFNISKLIKFENVIKCFRYNQGLLNARIENQMETR
jgi:AAA15 family ATPase/GTPase